MEHPSSLPSRISEDAARHLLARAAALDTGHVSLAQLREAAAEAGIAPVAFDAALREWQLAATHAVSREAPPPSGQRRFGAALLRNLLPIASSWGVMSIASALLRYDDASWLGLKFAIAASLTGGALLASRLRARPATVLLGGLAIAVGAEFVMDALAGVPTVRGFGAHMALIVAGVAGMLAGSRRRPYEPTQGAPESGSLHTPPADAPPAPPPSWWRQRIAAALAHGVAAAPTLSHRSYHAASVS